MTGQRTGHITHVMTVRFVMGRAGAGKTAHCLGSIREELLARPLVGPKLMALVPEQASLQFERSLVCEGEISSIHRAEVLSFRRLAFRVLEGRGAVEREALSPAARTMVLRRLMIQHADGLRFYRRMTDRYGFLQRLGMTLSELIEEAVGPEELSISADGDRGDAMHAAKLHDLRLIYEAYLQALGERWFDPAQYLEAARRELGRCEWIRGALVWVDGFAGFSRLERLTLCDLATMVGHVDIAMLIDPAAVDGRAGRTSSELFSRTAHTIGQLVQLFSERGVAIESPLKLTGRSARFAGRPRLAAMERCLFDTEPAVLESAEGDIELIEAADRRTEVEWAVSRIGMAVQRKDQPLRYRDIAIIVRQMESYESLLSQALRSRGVPFFIDRRRSVAHHPLVELLRSLCGIMVEDYSLESARVLLKCGLLSLNDDDGDALENYLLAVGVGGRSMWVDGEWKLPPRARDNVRAAPRWDMERILRARELFLRDVDGWASTFGRDSVLDGESWSAAIRAVLDGLGAWNQVERWADEAEDDGNLDGAEEHRQCRRDVERLIDDLGTAMGGERISGGELQAIVDAGLAQMTLGLAPPMLDQILIGSVERSRHPDIKLAIVMGVNDGVFPWMAGEDVILNDDDRALLESQGVSLGPTRASRLMDEASLFYVACTRPSEALVVTYSATDDSGKPLPPSPFVEALGRASGGVKVSRVANRLASGETWAIHTARDLAGQLAFEFRRSESQDESDIQRGAVWNGLYRRAVDDPEIRSALGSVLQSLVAEQPAKIHSGLPAGTAKQPFSASVSQLETYAECPFKHHVRYRLGLQERETASLTDRDVGTIHHAVMERLIHDLTSRNESLNDLDEAGLRSVLVDSLQSVTSAMALTDELSQARDRYLLSRSRGQLAEVLSVQRRVHQAGRFRARAAELKFGFSGDDSLPALALVTPAGRHVLLRGIIDRVDLAELTDEVLGIVIDYKQTRDKRLDLSQVFHGLSLQLMGYLLVLSAHGRTLAGRTIKPVGAFFVSLGEQYKNVRHPGDFKEGDDVVLRTHRPRGFMRETHLIDFESDPDASGWSPYFAIYRKKDGTLGHLDRSDAVQEAEFEAVLDHTRRKLGEHCDRILAGDIVVEPYRLRGFSPCSWCSYAAVCRFDSGMTRVRRLDTFQRGEILERIWLASDGGDA